MPTQLPTPPAIYSCKHGEEQLGEFVRPICDKCRKPLRHPTFERPDIMAWPVRLPGRAAPVTARPLAPNDRSGLLPYPPPRPLGPRAACTALVSLHRVR